MIAFPLDNVEYEAIALGSWCGTRTRGVFADNGHFDTATNGNMTVTVSPGLAWLKMEEFWGVSMFEDSATLLKFDTADGALARKDAICIQLNKNLNSSALVVKKGSYTPQPAVMAPVVRNLDYDEIYVAEVTIRAGATEILLSDIRDLRTNEAYCGIMRDGVTGIPTQALYDQWIAQLSEQKIEWETWVASLKDILDDEVAGNLQLEIEMLQTAIHHSKFLTASDIPTVSIPGGTGEIVTFEATNAEGVPMEVAVEVVAEQEGEGDPSPVDVWVGGTNLAKNNMATSVTAGGVTYAKNPDGSITANGTPANTNGVMLWNPMQLPYNQQYVLNGSSANIVVEVRVYTTAGYKDMIAQSVNGSQSTFSLPPPGEGEYYRLAIYARSASVGTAISGEIVRPQISLTNTSYEPYSGNTYTLTPSAPLYGLESAPDEIRNDGTEIRRTIKRTFDGTDVAPTSWQASSLAPASGYCYGWTFTGAAFEAISNYMKYDLRCSHFKPMAAGKTYSQANIGECYMRVPAAMTHIIFHVVSDINNLNDFRAWVGAQAAAGNPLWVLAEAAEPTITSTQPVTIPAQNGANTVFSSAGITTVEPYQGTVQDALDELNNGKLGKTEKAASAATADKATTADKAATADIATKLANSRTFQTNLASTSAAGFDGTGNNTHGVTGVLPIGGGGNGTTTGISSATQSALNQKLNLSAGSGSPLSGNLYTQGIYPTANASYNMGNSSTRYDGIYLVNSPNVSSDRRLKDNIEEITPEKALALIMGLAAKQYTMKAAKDGKTHYGVIAQDALEALKAIGMGDSYFVRRESVYEGMDEETLQEMGVAPEDLNPDTAPEDKVAYGVCYTELIAPMLAVMQQQQKRIEALEAMISGGGGDGQDI